MSRSEKRTPIVKDRSRNGQKYLKRQASKAARRSDIPNGAAYRKVYDSWRIHDWTWTLWSYVKHDRHPNLNYLRFFWRK